MHGYASDNPFRGPKVYFIFGVAAVAATSTLRATIVLPQLLGRLDSAALSAGAIYAALIFVYDRWGWRWLSTLKNLNGTWVGTISSSHDGGGTTVPCVLHIRQTWTRMAIQLETARSRSRTTMSALYEDQPGDSGLKYEYVSEPRSLAAPTMHPHRGFCSLAITANPGGARLNGDYFTGPGRDTHGEINVQRIARKLLSFDAAAYKDEQ